MSSAEEDQTPNISDVDFDEDEEVADDDGREKESHSVIPRLYSKFLEEQRNSENDPPETPYKSKYAARKALRELHGLLSTQLALGDNPAAVTSTPVSSEAESTADVPTEDGNTENREAGEPAAAHQVTPAGNGECGGVGDGTAGDDEMDHLTMPRNVLHMLLGHIHLQLGVNYYETEQRSEGERNLLKAYEYLAPYRNTAECILGFVSACNQVSYMLSNRSEFKASMPYLKEAEQVYTHFTTDGAGLTRAPRGVHELFLPSAKLQDGAMELVKGHTHTLYFLAQVYKEMNETALAARYCMATLQRQLTNNIHDPLDWALNCGTLSCYFISQGHYPEAVHCLACSSRMLAKFQEKKSDSAEVTGEPKAEKGEEMASEDGEPAAESEDLEETQRKVASVSRLWVSYAMSVLDDSKREAEFTAEMSEEELAAHKKNREAEAKKATEGVGREASNGDESVSDVIFDIDGLDEFTKNVPTALVTQFEQARGLFLLAQRHVETAKQFFTMDDHCTDYAELTQNLSQVFHRLAFFEQDRDRICKMHRRRADMLIAVAENLNPQFYLHIVRQLRFEAAEALVSLLDIKLENYEEQKAASRAAVEPKVVKKINQLVRQAREQFEAFYGTLRDPAGRMPETLSEDVARPALLCKFHIARLYSKIVTLDIGARIQNLKQSLRLHTEIVEQCRKQVDLTNFFKVELEVSTEMVSLLPKQLDQLSKLQ